MFHYKAFGLHICSEIRFPEFAVADPGESEIMIRRRTFDRPWPTTAPWQVFEFHEPEYYLCFVSFSRYLVRNGSEIDVEVAPGFREDLLGFQMLGPVMAALLHQRGMMTLHGSAANFGAHSAIFLGHKGAGKSTTIGSVIAAGHELITDDVVALDETYRLFPAYPTIKLTDAALDVIGRPLFEIIPTVADGVEKQRVKVKTGFAQEAKPPSHIFILERGDRPKYTCLSPLDGLRALIAFSYNTRFGNSLMSGQAAAVHLQQCTGLTSRVAIGTLEVPSEISQIPDALRLIEDLIAK